MRLRQESLLAGTALVVAGALVPGGGLAAQQPDSLVLADSLVVLEPARRAPLPEDVVVHLGHLTTSFPDTPSRMGLVATGLAEAAIAAEYVALAGRDSTDLGGLSRPMSGVIHAIDPGQASGGPGLGYGFKRAAVAVGAHAALAGAPEGASNTVRFHIPFVERAANDAAGRADEAIALARQVQRAPNAEAAFRLVKRLANTVRAMAYGDDRDGDHRIGYGLNESGLAQARYHLDLIYRVEGLDMPPTRRAR